MNKRILSVFMALCILLGCMSTVFASEPEAKEFSDMPENWATEALESAVANGLLRGADGKIMPDSPLTRAQMAAIIVRAFAAIDKSDISTYVDVRSSDWFADDIAKADKMGVMQGYGDGIMNPNGNITREQAFTVLARALKLAPASDIDVSFQDVDEISEWAKGPVYALVNAGYVQGSNGRLNPKSSIRRDEFAQLMYNLIKQYITDGGEYTEVAEGNIMVNAPGVTLKGVTIDGDLIIGDGVGDGEVILDDVIVTGRLVVRGGGENSIIIRGSSSISNVIVARVDGVVRVFVDDGSEVGVIYVDDGSDDVIVEGSIGRLEVGADSVTVTATDADINSASISGVNSAIIVDADSNIESIEISGADASVDVAGRVNSVTTTAANTSITGKGTVRNVAVQAGADGAAIETPKTKIQVDEGVTGVTGGGGAEIEAG
ncbi:MAG: S-layer homology domain-containing protein, partial [Eubacteriales bacterium]